MGAAAAGGQPLAWPGRATMTILMIIALGLVTPITCDSAPLVETNLKLVEDFVVAFEIR